MKVFQDPATGNYFREDGQPGYACARCGNGYATAPTRDDITGHGCEGLSFDLDSFEDAKGLFAEGYTSEDIDALNTDTRTVEFLCVWVYRDDEGFGGDSEVIGREVLPDGSRGTWKPLEGSFAAFLYDRTSPVTIADVEALLAPDDYEVQDFEGLPTYTGTNVAYDEKNFSLG